VQDRDQQERLVCGHIRRLKATYPDSTIYVAVENNLGMEASHIGKMVGDMDIDEVNVVHQVNGKTGVHTTLQSKNIWVYGLQRMLEDRCLSICESVISRNAQECVREFERQLKSFCRIKTMGGSTTFSGKQAGANDDMVMATLISVAVLENVRKRKMTQL